MNQMIDITDNPGVKVNDFVTAGNIAETLHKHYPGHLWAVTCEGEKGIATVRNMSLSGNWGFILKLKDVYADGRFKCVIQAGGEILERFRLSRGRANRDRIDELPTIVSGAPVFDPAMAKSKVPKLFLDAWGRDIPRIDSGKGADIIVFPNQKKSLEPSGVSKISFIPPRTSAMARAVAYFKEIWNRIKRPH